MKIEDILARDTTLVPTIISAMKAIDNGGFKCGRNEIEMIKTSDLLHFNVISMYVMGEKFPNFFLEVHLPDVAKPIGSIAPVRDEETGRIINWLIIRRFEDRRYVNTTDGLWEDMAHHVIKVFFTKEEVFQQVYREAALDNQGSQIGHSSKAGIQERTHNGHPVESISRERFKDMLEMGLSNHPECLGVHYGYFEIDDESAFKDVVFRLFTAGDENGTYPQALMLDGNSRFGRILGSFHLRGHLVQMKSQCYQGEKVINDSAELFDAINEYLVRPSRAYNTHF
uniref:Uncharacterized protein n=1 Tax=Pantoea phage Survivor TaxID=3232176 RepID=A0AAU8KXP0_9CAUD